MKQHLFRACGKIGRFFWSWGFLKLVLWMITLVVLFYVEEDWRGARAWAATKSEWEAKGYTFDRDKFTPPPVPDDENLAAIPLFKLEMVEWTKGKFDSQQLALKRAMRSDPPGNDLPPRGNWMAGELADREKLRGVIATDYAAAFPGATPPADTLAQFDALYPFTADLRAASATRPKFRLNVDYSVYPPFSRSLGYVTASIRLAQILTLHATLALDHRQPDLALQDLKINYKLLAGAERDPSLVGGLVAVGVNAISQGAIYNGLCARAWNDPHLSELEQMLGCVQFLADYRFDIRNTAAESVANIEYIKNSPRFQQGDIFGMSEISLPWWLHVPFLWPRGWWDWNQTTETPFLLRRLAGVDDARHRVYPEKDLAVTQELKRAAAGGEATAPWNFWVTLTASNLDSMLKSFAYGQTWVDEARIACALERYRLAHGVYPAALDALAPAYIDSIPHDVITGDPYRYILRPDGTFLLYSVGWNQRDDGGTIVFEKNSSLKIDNSNGDWVWPEPKVLP